MNSVLARILRDRLIAVVRIDSADHLPEVISALVDGGMTIVEITLTIPGALAAMNSLTTRFGSTCLIGAGTVLDSDTARQVIDSGASFVVSPVMKREIVETCRSAGIAVMPGAYTPTEIVAAWEAGADIVKVFPADGLGPAYFKALHGPLPHIRLMPTGGVDLQSAVPFLRAGACCLGIGSQLVDQWSVCERRFDRIEAKARQFRELEGTVPNRFAESNP